MGIDKALHLLSLAFTSRKTQYLICLLYERNGIVITHLAMFTHITYLTTDFEFFCFKYTSSVPNATADAQPYTL